METIKVVGMLLWGSVLVGGGAAGSILLLKEAKVEKGFSTTGTLREKNEGTLPEARVTIPDTTSKNGSVNGNQNKIAPERIATQSEAMTSNDEIKCKNIKSLGYAWATSCASLSMTYGTPISEGINRLIHAGNWDWSRKYIDGQCILSFRVEGVYQGNSYRKMLACPVNLKKYDPNCSSGLGDLACASEALQKPR
ncbi:hypothetical protein [Skermanella stibiiresistens]|uniref:hypothetical protein n=1 Tax=Skermanella stibiiresistens TaxID=913326 RepID=UPI0012FBC393|nr:hypothetical protein [Skermanella stibiiresistens]